MLTLPLFNTTLKALTRAIREEKEMKGIRTANMSFYVDNKLIINQQHVSIVRKEID